MVFFRKYNVTLTTGTVIRLPMIKAGANDYATSSDWTPATGDVKVSKDGGSEANIGTLPSYSNGAWEFTLTGTELSAKTIVVKVVDSATKAVEDQFIVIETYGHASAMWVVDMSDGAGFGLSRIDAAITSRNATAPDNASITAIKAKTDNLPSDPADASDIAAAFGSVSTSLSTISGYIDTEVGAIKTVTDHLGTALELDGSVYRFTSNALEQAPAGGGGGGGGGITLDTPLDLTPDAGSVGEALLAAWGDGYGRYKLEGTSFKLYGPDGTTVIREFTLDSATAPTSRTPV